MGQDERTKLIILAAIFVVLTSLTILSGTIAKKKKTKVSYFVTGILCILFFLFVFYFRDFILDFMTSMVKKITKDGSSFLE